MKAPSEQDAIARIEEHLKVTGYKTPKFLEKIWERSKKTGTDKMTLRKINAVIKEARKELQQKQK
jgi:mannitol/fructose-specific phosphotransferase system IIA component